MSNENRELKASTIAKREKKSARREAKAARKAANQVEEKKSRPNNIILAIMIFGVLLVMFAAVKGYTYFSKDASIEAYIANNGGEETYGSMALDAYTTANITAEGNSMKLVVSVDPGDDEEIADLYKEYYEGDDGEESLKYFAAYYLTSIKPEVRGFSADVKASLEVGGEEIKTVEMTYKEAKKFLEADDEEDADAGADADTDAEADEDAGSGDDAGSDDSADGE